METPGKGDNVMKLLAGFLVGAAVAAVIAYYTVGRQPAPAPPAEPVAAETLPPAEPAPPVAEPAVPEPVQKAVTPEPPARPAARTARNRAPEPPAAPVEMARKSEPVVSQPPPAPAPAPPVAAQAPPPPAPPSPPAQPEPAVVAEPPAPPRKPRTVTIPAGTLVSVRLVETLNSEVNVAGDNFTATLDRPLVIEDLVLAERGARLQGKVVTAEKAGRVKGTAELGIQLLSFQTTDGQKVAIQTETFTKEGPATRGEDAAKVGAAAGIGAAIGAIAGGGKGAAIGAAVGGAAGAGGVAATRGKLAELPVETRITFRINAPVTITEHLR